MHNQCISVFLSSFISTLVPRPSLLMLNAGHHPNQYHNESHRDGVVAAALSVTERVVWKTTSWHKEALLAEAGSSYSATDPLMCAYAGLRCVDLGWINYLSPGDFIDSLHFQPAIYSDINTQFLLQLRSEQCDSLVIAESAHGSSADSKYFYVDTTGRLNHTTSATSTACPSKEVHRLPERQPREGHLPDRRGQTEGLRHLGRLRTARLRPGPGDRAGQPRLQSLRAGPQCYLAYYR